MNRLSAFMVPATALLGVTLLAGQAFAQQKTLKEQIVGTWLAVSNVAMRPDGVKTESFGPNPKGTFMFESNGRVALLMMRPDLPKFASNNRATGTAEENKAVVQGSNAYFGAYSVNEAEKSITIQIEAATFPNWAGTTEKRLVAISGDELTVTGGVGSAGTTLEAKWKRAK